MGKKTRASWSDSLYSRLTGSRFVVTPSVFNSIFHLNVPTQQFPFSGTQIIHLLILHMAHTHTHNPPPPTYTQTHTESLQRHHLDRNTPSSFSVSISLSSHITGNWENREMGSRTRDNQPGNGIIPVRFITSAEEACDDRPLRLRNN